MMHMQWWQNCNSYKLGLERQAEITVSISIVYMNDQKKLEFLVRQHVSEALQLSHFNLACSD